MKIKTEKEYKSALKLAKKFWDSEPHTSQEKGLERLITRIEKYEEKHYPMASFMETVNGRKNKWD
jgi:HTH-type transcriptional regulator/antitoxin HigA